MKTDWTAVERDYVRLGATYAGLAAKYGVSRAAVAHHGAREGWRAKRLAHLRGVPEAKKRPVRPAARDVDGGALRGKLLALADEWTDSQGGHLENVGDYRRVVQSVLDLTRAEGDAAPPEVRVVVDAPEGYAE